MAATWTALIGGNFQTGFLLLLGATSAQIGLMAALPPLSNLAQVLAGYVTARQKRRKPLMISTAFVHRLAVSLVGFIPLVLPKFTWVWATLAVYFIGNLTVAFAMPSWSSMMADMVPAAMRGRYFGLRNGLTQVVGVIVVLISGRVLDKHAGYAGFYGLYVVALIIGMADVAGFLAQPEPPYVHTKPQSLASHLVLPFQNAPFRLMMVVNAALTMVGAVASPFYAVHMLKEMHLSYSMVAAVTTAATISGIASYMSLGRVLDRVGEFRTLRILVPLLALVPMLWLFVRPEHPALLFLVFILSGALAAGSALSLNNVNIRLSSGENRPIFMATFSALGGLGGFVAPILGGMVMERLGFNMLLYISAAGYLLVGAIWWRVSLYRFDDKGGRL